MADAADRGSALLDSVGRTVLVTAAWGFPRPAAVHVHVCVDQAGYQNGGAGVDAAGASGVAVGTDDIAVDDNIARRGQSFAVEDAYPGQGGSRARRHWGSFRVLRVRLSSRAALRDVRARQLSGPFGGAASTAWTCAKVAEAGVQQ